MSPCKSHRGRHPECPGRGCTAHGECPARPPHPFPSARFYHSADRSPRVLRRRSALPAASSAAASGPSLSGAFDVRHPFPPADRQERHLRGRAAAGAGQPSRPHHRRHRHRQDRHPAAPGRTVLGHRCAGVHGRREGGSHRHLPAGPDEPQAADPARAARPAHAAVHGLPGHALGCLWQAGAPRARHHLRHGAAAAVAHAGPQRHAGRRAQPHFQGGG